ncbi:TonB-dependent receptor [Brevundimonas sp.]|uniref:TonB-dependent receptor n=1 Tax=Brevundimonas sp. TaxID=1871086 RepID=UPI002FDB3F22
MNVTRSRSRALRRSLIAGTSGLAIALSVGAVAASAQTAPQEPSTTVDEVVVTGFRASLNAALDIKRNETGFVDAIVAEDIADFPDLNLAEAIQRVPGVAIDRDAGEGRSITVRGLSSDFTRTRINGMEAQATTGATDSSGGANRGRGFDFNVFASELFNSIKVRKTAAAETEEGSLGATVDLQAARPFDYRGFAAAASIQGGYNDLSEQWNPRGAFLISNTFNDGMFGALMSIAYSERDLIEEGFSSVRWVNAMGTGGSGGFCSPLGVATQNPSNSSSTGSSAANCATGVARPANTAANVNAYNIANQANVYIPRLPRYGRLTHHQERTGVTGAFQFRPSDATTINLDVLYSKLNSTRQEDFLEALSFSRNAAAGGQTQIHVLDAAVDNNMLVYGLFNNVDVRSESRFDQLTTKFTQVSLSADHQFTDRLRGSFYAGQATSNYNNPIQTTVTLDRQNVQGYSFDFRGNGNTPVINYGFNVADPANWAWRDVSLGTGITAVPRSEIRIRPNGVDTKFTGLQGDLEFDLAEGWTLKGGINYKTYLSESYEFRRTDETVVPTLPGGVTVANISNLLSGFGSGLSYGGDTGWVRPDLGAIASLFNIYCNCNTGVAGGDFTLTSITNGNARGGNRTIEETDLAYYLQADFDLVLGGMPVRGNLGVRQVNTRLYAEGYSSTGGGTLVYGNNEYDDTLPSLNVAIEPIEDVIVRFGVAKVMARPQIGNTLAGTNYLVPTTSLSTTGPNFTASIGNVNLEPFRATTYDVGVEWYFGDGGLLSFAYFYKDIDTYIQIIRQDLEYQQLTALNPSAFAPAYCTGVCSSTTIFQLTSAVNTEGGPLKGFEISYQQPFTFLPGFLSNFGVQANYTKVESEIDYCNDALCATYVTNDLINLSPTSYNGTLYYETDRFSARVSAAFREEYLQNVPGRNNNLVEGKMDTMNIDASATFKLTDEVTLTFEGLNLTDEENHQWVGDDSRQSTSVYHHTGRQFYFGARYKF